MSWNQADLERIQELYGEAAEITAEGEDTLRIKVNEELVAVPRFVEGFMEIAGNVVLFTVSAMFSVAVKDDAQLEMVKAAAEKHGLRLVPVDDNKDCYRVVLKNKDGE
jgi:hypothetical protein